MPSVRVLEPSRATFCYSALIADAPATPTDLITLKGAAGKIIQLRRVFLTALGSATGSIIVSLVKRSTANTGGTFTTPLPTQGDQDGLSAVVVNRYTVNPATLGTVVATRSRRLLAVVEGTGTPDRVTLEFGDNMRGMKGLRLNSASEWFAINLNGGAIPAAFKFDCELEWTEQ